MLKLLGRKFSDSRKEVEDLDPTEEVKETGCLTLYTSGGRVLIRSSPEL